MKKITVTAADYFMQRRNRKLHNTEVRDGVLYLFGNAIARHSDTGHIEVCTAGWDTMTTRERLNGLPGVSVYRDRGRLYLNGKVWDGQWRKVQSTGEQDFRFSYSVQSL